MNDYLTVWIKRCNKRDHNIKPIKITVEGATTIKGGENND